MKKRNLCIKLGGVLVALLLFGGYSVNAEDEPCPPEEAGCDFICIGGGACRVEARNGKIYICDGIPDDMTGPILD